MSRLTQQLADWYARTFPSSGDEAEDRRRQFMVVVALGSLPLLLVGVGHEGFVGNPVGVVINAAMAAVNLVVVFALGKGYSSATVGWPLMLFQVLVSNLAAAAVGGADSSGFAGNVVVLVFAAIVLPRIAVPIFVLLITLLGWLMFQYPMVEVVEFSEDMHVWSWMVCLAMASGMVAALVSVTERSLQRAREKSDALESTVAELQRTSVSRDFVQNVVSAIPDFVIVTGADRRVQMVNEALAKRARWSLDDLTGKPLSDLVVGVDGLARSGEAALRCADGATIPVAINVGELPATSDDESLSVWSATDIRAQHATQDALRQAHQRAQAASKAKSNFLANMSHELRTPLNAIIGYGELLADDIEDDAQQADLDKIGTAARTLLDLINGVLDLSRIESGKVELQLADTTVSDIVDDVIDIVRPLATARGLELRATEVERDGPPVYVDRGKLRQVVTNLLTNAVKFTRQGTVELSVERWKRSGLDWLRIVVTDTGIGMSSEDLAEVFEPFAQGADHQASEFGGTGLGLSICHAFIEMMGGQIHAESEVGRGSRFVVEVPAAAASSLRATPTPSRKLPQAQDDAHTILVVDDDPRFLELVERVLADDGRQVVCASDAASAIDWAASNAADLIILDVEMPGIDGWTFLVRLRNTLCGSSPVAVISAEADAQVARALGADRFLQKPIRNDALRRLAEELISEDSPPAV